MMSLQVRMALTGAIDKYDQALAVALTGAVRSAVGRIRTQGRRQIERAGLGRLAKAFRGTVRDGLTGKNLTQRGNTVEPRGRVYSAAGVKGRVDDVLEVFERGVVVLPKQGTFLAIPTAAAGGRRGKQPSEYPDGTFRAVPIGGARGRRGAKNARRWVLIHKTQNAIWFILVPRVKLKRRLRLRATIERIGGRVADDADRRWARAVARLEKVY